MDKAQSYGPSAWAVGLLLGLVALAACGASPQAPGGQAGPTADAPPTAYPAPLGEATAYPAPLGEATAYPAPLGEAPQVTADTAVPAPTRPPVVVTAAPTGAGQAAAATAPANLSFGAVPAAKAALAVADLVQRTGATPSGVSVVSAEAVEWSDGSIGCPKPDMMYPQVITPGYRLVLSVGGQEYSYHASENGDFFLCQNPDGARPLP